MSKTKPNVKLKTIQFIIDKKYNNIFNEMAYISKNIYNCCIYSNNIFTLFKNNVYKEMYDFFSIINNTNIPKKRYIMKMKNNTDIIVDKLKVYYDIYTNNLQLIKTNNTIIFEYIKNKINTNNIILNSFNIKQFYKETTKELNNKVSYNISNKEYVFTNIIDRIIKSFYNKKYFLTRYQMLNHIKCTFNDEQLINDIKDNYYYYDNFKYINYKKKIESDFKVVLDSDQYIFKKFVYNYGLSNNKDKLPADIILNIIDKYYEAIKSYYGKLNKKLKADKPKYLGKNDKFNLFYYPSSFKRFNNCARLTVGSYIADNYNNINKSNINKLSNRKYYNNSNIVNNIKNKNKKDYIKLDNGFINKQYILDANFMYLKLPNILNNKKVKLIQIKPNEVNFTAYVTYEEIVKNIKINNIIPTVDNAVSIDTGIKNLLTIYNPTGNQYIIRGGKLKSINEFYNKKISKLQSINKKTLGINKFNRLYSLLNERKNKINGEINKIISILLKVYPNKICFIVGYNENWKTNVNLGKNTNRNFYQIPYARLLLKLKDKLEANGKQLIINEESYTSLCDSLSLEHLGKKNKYMGERVSRGLYLSKTGKAINADLNGAINIMRKVIDLKEVSGENIFNPKILKA